MSAHSVRGLQFEMQAPPIEVLGIARALASQPVAGDGGAAFDERILALAPGRVTVRLGDSGFVRRATPPLARRAVATPARTPAVPVATVPGAPPRAARPGRSGRHVTPRPADNPGGGVSDSGIRYNTGELLAKELTGIPRRARDLNDLLDRLAAADDPSTAQQVVDNVAREAEQRARDGLFVDLAEVMWRLHERHEALHDGDLQRAFRQGVRRLEKPALMHGLAGLLPHRREMRDKVTMILARSNEVGAEALIDCLVNSDSTAERKAYRVALSQCPAAVPALLHLLGDERWYVVRNAVELLGELHAEGVESRLASALNHHEPRVRRSAAIALAKAGTSAAVLVLLQHVNDPSPDVRLQVALGLGEVRNPRAVPWLIEALEKEEDPEVQAAILGALGRMPTDDAIERLSRAAQPGGLLMRKPAAQRITAVEALGAAGTPNALSVLRGLQKDRDRAVRTAVERALGARRDL
jgi:hypothetical protein